MEALSKAVYCKQTSFSLGVDGPKAGTCKAVKDATTLLYSAAYAQYAKHQEQLRVQWEQSGDEYACLYRLIRSKHWPPLARESVVGAVPQQATGSCLGVSRGQSPNAYCNISQQYVDVAQAIVTSALAAFPDFQFTSIQVNNQLASVMHTDGGNVGPSLIVSLGPCT